MDQSASAAIPSSASSRDPILGTSDGRAIGSRELVALLGLSTSSAALAIDSMLPAFADMRADLGLPAGSTAVGAVITAFFAGLAVGQLIYGPLADRFGRRPVIRAGFILYIVFAVAAGLAPNLGALIALRFAWGVAASGPRVVSMAIVRDTYDGPAVSQVMSSLMAVFILVPIIAPLLGAGIVAVASWRWLFAFCGLFTAALLIWSTRLPETLRPEHRMELSARHVLAAGRVVLSERAAVGHLLAVTSLMGAFIAYLSGFESIVDQTYDRASWFPAMFGLLAAAMGVFMLANRRLVSRYGSLGVIRGALTTAVIGGAVFSVVVTVTDGHPPLWVFLAGMAALLSCNALLLPNLTAMALEPLGAIAGTASSIIGSVQTAIGALAGSALMATFDGTARPLVYGFFGFAILSAVFAYWARGGSDQVGVAVATAG